MVVNKSPKPSRRNFDWRKPFCASDLQHGTCITKCKTQVVSQIAPVAPLKSLPDRATVHCTVALWHYRMAAFFKQPSALRMQLGAACRSEQKPFLENNCTF
jgi:hypothetical protein